MIIDRSQNTPAVKTEIKTEIKTPKTKSKSPKDKLEKDKRDNHVDSKKNSAEKVKSELKSKESSSKSKIDINDTKNREKSRSPRKIKEEKDEGKTEVKLESKSSSISSTKSSMSSTSQVNGKFFIDLIYDLYFNRVGIGPLLLRQLEFLKSILIQKERSFWINIDFKNSSIVSLLQFELYRLVVTIFVRCVAAIRNLKLFFDVDNFGVIILLVKYGLWSTKMSEIFVNAIQLCFI